MSNSSSPRDYSFIAPFYDRIFNLPLAEGHRKLGQLMSAQTRKRGRRVLEVGVGSGLTLGHLPKGLLYTGIDINQRMLDIAQQKVSAQGLKGVRLALMDARKLSFADESYDLVVASSVISAMDNPMKGFREMARVTKQGGQIAVIVNLRRVNSLRSNLVKWFDPLTRRYLGFRTDLTLASFKRLRNVRLIEHQQVNTLVGMPLSSFLLFEKL